MDVNCVLYENDFSSVTVYFVICLKRRGVLEKQRVGNGSREDFLFTSIDIFCHTQSLKRA